MNLYYHGGIKQLIFLTCRILPLNTVLSLSSFVASNNPKRLAQLTDTNLGKNTLGSTCLDALPVNQSVAFSCRCDNVLFNCDNVLFNFLSKVACATVRISVWRRHMDSYGNMKKNSRCEFSLQIFTPRILSLIFQNLH